MSGPDAGGDAGPSPQRPAPDLRRQAEVQALDEGAPSAEDGDALSPAGARRTLHELRVHQIELEMQNEELRRAQRALEASQQRYFDLYDLSPAGYCTISAKGLISEANLATAAFLGVTRSALIRQPLSPFIHPEDLGLYYQHRTQLLDSGEPQAWELRMVRKDGTPFWARLEAVTGHAPSTCNLVLGDISAHKRTEEVLGLAMRQAQEASQAKSRFLANMSHEIRTPLNGIIGLTSILKRSPLNEDQLMLMDMVQHSGDNLQLLINDFLDMARIEAGNLTVDSVPVDLLPLIAGVRDTILGGLAARPVTISVHIAPELDRPILADPVRLRQILLNLLGNAVKFTPRGSVTLTLGQGTDAAGRPQVVFEVRDTGIGIPVAYLPHLFEPFTQADTSNTRSFGGTGLGLSIVKSLVDLMQGTISIDSVQGVGTTCRVAIPAIMAPRPTTTASTTTALPALDVLVVDDHAITRATTCRMLELLGCRHHQAADGDQALAMLAEQRFDVVLMDCQMPGRDGGDTVREIRRRELGGATRQLIIAMTASVLTSDRHRATAAGMDDFLAKPFRIEELLVVLARWAGRAMAQRSP